MVWLFLAIFITPYVAKSAHMHVHADVCPGAGHAKHDCDNCPVCQFSFSSFVETEPLEIRIPVARHAVDPVVYQEHILLHAFFPRCLRGPPANG
ncbi:MAG: hypothetical protein LBR10_05050 [Prevotellaceae bacterium]|nr:hypothetical protein [Prevotellaceae bacterium]